MPITAEPADPGDDDVFDLTAVTCNVAVLKIAGFNDHVLFDDGARSLQLNIQDGTLLQGPVRFRYDLRGFTALDRKLDSLRQLDAIHRYGSFPGARPLRAHRWVLALRALDLMRRGASYRDIAIDLYGLPADAPGWRLEHDYIRNRVRRLVRLAEAMVQGGYLRLLQS